MLMISFAPLMLDDRDSHDVEDTAGVGVFEIGQLLVTRQIAVDALNLAVHLSAIGAFEVEPVLAMRLHGPADGRISDLLLGDLFDVERFFVADGKPAPNLLDHVLDGDLPRRRPRPPFGTAGAELHLAACVSHLTLILDGGLDHLGSTDLLHQLRDAARFDELGTDIGREGDKFADLLRIGDEAGQEVERLDQSGQEIDVALAVVA